MILESFGPCNISGGGWNGVVRIGGEGVSKSVAGADPEDELCRIVSI